MPVGCALSAGLLAVLVILVVAVRLQKEERIKGAHEHSRRKYAVNIRLLQLQLKIHTYICSSISAMATATTTAMASAQGAAATTTTTTATSAHIFPAAIGRRATLQQPFCSIAWLMVMIRVPSPQREVGPGTGQGLLLLLLLLPSREAAQRSTTQRNASDGRVGRIHRNLNLSATEDLTNMSEIARGRSKILLHRFALLLRGAEAGAGGGTRQHLRANECKKCTLK